MTIFSDPRWGEALGHLGDYLGNHVRVSVTALLLGLLVSLPLAIISRDRPLFRGILLGLVVLSGRWGLLPWILGSAPSRGGDGRTGDQSTR